MRKKMMKTMIALALLPLLALSATAQEVPYGDLAAGDRLEVTFQSGNTIVGTLVSPNPKATLDFSKESSLVLDVTWEYPGLNGTMTVQKKEIKSFRKLRVMDEKTRQNLIEMKKKIAAENAKTAEPKADPSPVEPKAEPKPDASKTDEERKKAEEKARLEAEEKKKAMDFYAKFPSPYWGPERHIMNVQKKARGQALSAAETEFEKDYVELWDLGRTASTPKKD
jgi:hypothetical protein